MTPGTTTSLRACNKTPLLARWLLRHSIVRSCFEEIFTWVPCLFLMGFDRTDSPDAFAQAATWPTAPDRPRLPRGHYLCAPKRYSLGDATEKRLGCGSGMTCWRRLRDWQQDGIWDFLHFALLDWLSRDGQIDWSCAVVDSYSVRAVFGGC